MDGSIYCLLFVSSHGSWISEASRRDQNLIELKSGNLFSTLKEISKTTLINDYVPRVQSTTPGVANLIKLIKGVWNSSTVKHLRQIFSEEELRRDFNAESRKG